MALRGTVTSKFYLAGTFGRLMVDQGEGGCIVNTTSTAGAMALPNFAALLRGYAAVAQLTRNMAAELAPHGIRANAMLLGTFENMGSLMPPQFQERWLAQTPLKRFGRQEQVAR